LCLPILFSLVGIVAGITKSARSSTINHGAHAKDGTRRSSWADYLCCFSLSLSLSLSPACIPQSLSDPVATVIVQKLLQSAAKVESDSVYAALTSDRDELYQLFDQIQYAGECCLVLVAVVVVVVTVVVVVVVVVVVFIGES
jgi:hypothetical protein